MNKIKVFALAFAIVFGGELVASGQDSAMDKGNSATPPPKILAINREFLKPGRNGEVHKKAEAAFVRAMSSAKAPSHYLAVTSITGRPRALFLTGYDSFASFEQQNKAIEKNATLGAALDRAAMNDGDLLSDYDSGIFVYREDYSLNAPVDIAHMRFFEIAQFHTKPGHDKEWEEGVKMVLKAYEKMPDMHFACYQVLYGAHDGTYLFFTPLKSAADVDSEIAHNKDFASALGEDGMKQLAELSAASIDWSETNFFAFDPGMSYVQPEWIKADPDFWTPKMTSNVAMKKSGDKSSTAEKKAPQ